MGRVWVRWWPASCHLGLILAMDLSHGSVSWEAGSALVTHRTCVTETHPVTMPTSHHNSGPCRTLRFVRQDPAPLCSCGPRDISLGPNPFRDTSAGTGCLVKSVEPSHWGGVACIQWDPKFRVGSLWHPRPLLCWFFIYFETVSCNPAWPRTLSVAKAGFELSILLLPSQESSEGRTLTSDFSAILKSS